MACINLLCVLILVGARPLYAQEVEKKMIVHYGEDLNMINAHSVVFNRTGNYCFETRLNNRYYLLTNFKQYLGFAYYKTMNDGNTELEIFYNSPDTIYYKNMLGTLVYGPIRGDLGAVITGKTENNLATTANRDNKVFYYVNSSLVNVRDLADAPTHDTDWCAFSENGHALYYTYKNKKFYLYLNFKVVDSSAERFGHLAVNNDLNYCYSIRKEVAANKRAAANYQLHIGSKSFGPVSSVLRYHLGAGANYYFAGEDYVLANDNLASSLQDAGNILLAEPAGYFYTYKKDNASYLNCNGKVSKLDYTGILKAAIDGDGNYTVVAAKDNGIYKVTSDKAAVRIDKPGQQLTPLWLDGKGSSVLLYENNDSVWLYKDDEVVTRTAKNTDYRVLRTNDIAYVNAAYTNEVAGVCTSAGCQLVYNSIVSPPLPAIKKQEKQPDGAMLLSGINEHGFYVIQQTGKDKYVILINNKIMKTIEGVEFAGRSSMKLTNCFLTDKEFIFYARQGGAYYQYKIDL